MHAGIKIHRVHHPHEVAQRHTHPRNAHPDLNFKTFLTHARI